MKRAKGKEVDLLMSINPEWTEKIISGEKKFEYRKSSTANDVNWIYIYVTNPIKKIIGKVKVVNLIETTRSGKKQLWEVTKGYSGITKEFFYDYFKNSNQLYAYQLGEFIAFKEPLRLKDIGLKSAPQSWTYWKWDKIDE